MRVRWDGLRVTLSAVLVVEFSGDQPSALKAWLSVVETKRFVVLVNMLVE